MRIAPFLLCASFLGASVPASPALAQDAPATTRLQDAQLTARGNTITITRLPIRTAAGTIYRDVTIELHVDAQGHVTLATDASGRAVAAGMPAPALPARPSGRQRQVALQSVPSGQPIELPQQPSAPIVYQKFTAGTYTAPDGSIVQVQDRGMDLIHRVPAWSLRSDNGAITEATFYSGPPFLNPRSTRLKRAEITSTQYAYGTSDAGTGAVFGTGALIGVKQSGPTLTIVSFHHGCCTDEPEPVATLIYTLLGH